MQKLHLLLVPALFLVFSCTTLRTATGKKSETASKATASSPSDIRFLEGIDVDMEKGRVVNEKQPMPKAPAPVPTHTAYRENSFNIENVSVLQLRYALILNTEIEQVSNLSLYQFIDEWYGTRYVLGGTTRMGIDCSAFTQVLFASMYGLQIPRTAKEQYRETTRISRTHLQEGDLVFFNTRGGISHVGVYLQNNKFVHASSSGGVMISDLYDEYWVRRFIGVGRVNPRLEMVIK